MPHGLLEFDRSAFGFELFLELFGFGLFEAGLDGLGSAIDQVLGFLEAQAGGLADDLDDLDFLVAGGLEDHVEGVLLGRCGSCRAAAITTPPPAGSILYFSLR